MPELTPQQKLQEVMSGVGDEGVFIPDLQYLGVLGTDTLSFVPDRIIPAIVASRDQEMRIITGIQFTGREKGGYPAEHFAPHTQLKRQEEGNWASAYLVGGIDLLGNLAVSLIGDIADFDYALDLHDRYGFTEIYGHTIALHPYESDIELPYGLSGAIREIMGWRYVRYMFNEYEDVMRCVKTSLMNTKNGNRGLAMETIMRRAGVTPKKRD